MSKNKSNRDWLHQHIRDPYVKQAQQVGYRARSVYKLQQIDEQERLFFLGQTVVDLGATPGSWSQYVRRKVLHCSQAGLNSGKIIALDVLPMESIEGVEFICGDFCELSVQRILSEYLLGKQVDVILSDMSPDLSGIAVVDASRVEYLLEQVVEFSRHHLKTSGKLLVKCFHGQAYDRVWKHVKHVFERVVSRKPRASRDRSSEVFILAQGLR